jgi:RND family efflux transporter MFP subunit
MTRKTLVVVAAIAAVIAVVGAWRWSATRSAAEAAAPKGAPAVSVSTVQAQQRDYDVLLEATGTVTALNSVDVKPQISAVITRVHISEGQFVKAGELLFTLDARAEEANLAKAQAELQKNQATLADTQRQLARSRELFAQKFVSEGAVDTSQAAVDSARAVVGADRAAIDAAKVALSLSRITAPGAGRAGAINVFAGSMVQPSSPALVTITQLDPIAVAFSLPQRHLPDALQSLRAGGGAVTALLPDGRGTLDGRLQFVDNTVDTQSGTVRVKAVFDNREQKLWPGAFVNVRLVVQTLKDATVVPQASIVQGARGKLVFVVDAGNKASARPVEVVHAAGQDAVVTGVGAGESVIVEGRQNLRPGSNVVIREVDGARADVPSKSVVKPAAAPGASRGAER